jgi:putative ABC transport system substrate-binding protein
VAAAVFAVAPASLLAQPKEKVWRVGFLGARRPAPAPEASPADELTRGLRELGYVEGKNLVFERRSADGAYDRLPELAAELVRLRVDVIVAAHGTPSAVAAQKATSAIPVVFVHVGDPVGTGLVRSLGRPGGNVTGISNLSNVVAGKQLETLSTLVRRLGRVGLLMNPTNPNGASLLASLREAGARIGVKVVPFEVRTAKEIDEAFAAMGRERPDALIVGGDSFLTQQARQIARLSAEQRIPSAGGRRSYPEAGGLLSYAPDDGAPYRTAATLVDKILKGAKPADLPVEQPTKFELVVNRKTAKALGIAISPELLVLADKVIE